MDTQITREMVDGYVTAVTAALKTAGHKLDDPFIDDQDDMVVSIMIGIPDALTDEHERLGLALLWEPGDGWVMAFMSHRYGNTVRVTGHTDPRLGVVPAPDVVVRSVAAVLADGDPRAGRIVPGPVELLAAYADGETPEAARVDLVAESERTGSFDYCIICGATDVAHRALYVRTVLSTTTIRVAWCSAARCQEDRERSAVKSVPVAAGPGGFYGVVDAW
ncbi:hypothetical protein GCM10022254_09650 [Actinomadura meridiana]|uniref:DUF6292 domain-containing protein n=1 Tax=Actinomadura meridiana TaxID=559626 RepID=A0ABP8BTS4_9ACTN